MKLMYFIKYRELNYIMSMDLIENILVPHNDATLSVFIDLAKTFESVSHPVFGAFAEYWNTSRTL